jgi:uncharacterized RDD family membrane protein YckC
VVEIVGRLYCATCKVEQVRDLQSGVDGMSLELAALDRRLVALVLDFAILSVPFGFGIVLAVQAFPSLRTTTGVLPQVLTFLFLAWLLIGYEGALLAWRGQTLGKQALGLKVVGANGGELRAGQAWLRAAARVVLSATVVVDYVPALFSRERVCLHDLVARTRVVRRSE